jgi:hypothetical protein
VLAVKSNPASMKAPAKKPIPIRFFLMAASLYAVPKCNWRATANALKTDGL